MPEYCKFISINHFTMSISRRAFVKNSALLAGGFAIAPAFALDTSKKSFFQISLAQWSLHKALFGKKMDNLDFPGAARKTYNIGVVEYVNQFFKDKAKDTAYLNQL